MRGSKILAGAVTAAALAACLSVSAHDEPTVAVGVTVSPDARWRLDAVLDLYHLPVPAAEGGPLPEPVAGLTSGLEKPFGKFVRAFLSRSRLLCDGKPLRPATVRLLASDDSDTTPVLRLGGALPKGARTLAFSSGMNIGTWILRTSVPGRAEAAVQWLAGPETSAPVPVEGLVAPKTRAEVIRQYLGLGFTHILPKGTDHILFVVGLFLLSLRLKPLLLQVTAFTAAHTITLALSIYGVFSLPPSVVEPLIALSIVYVAVENVVTSELKPWRPVVVLLFGLLHGLGFAGVLNEVGLPRSEFLTALLSFNAGVECGQLSVILAAFLLVALPFRKKAWYRQRIVIPGSLLIAAVGLYWSIQRIFF